MLLQESHEPQEVLSDGGLLAVGGSELTGGYKGYGLGMMVEIFCGILAGAEFGTRIRVWKDTTKIANLVSGSLPQLLSVDPDSVVMMYPHHFSTYRPCSCYC